MEQPVVQGVEQAGAVQPEVRTSDYDAIIKGIIAAGGKKLPGIRVKNANFTEKDNYTMVSFTLANKVRGYVRDEETGVYKEGMTNVIFTSLFAICGALKEDDEKAWIANHLLNHPTALPLLFAGSTIDIVQTKQKPSVVVLLKIVWMQYPYNRRGTSERLILNGQRLPIQNAVK